MRSRRLMAVLAVAAGFALLGATASVRAQDYDNDSTSDADEIANCPPGDPDCADCNGNSVPDECDIENDPSQDCNNNSVPDECDIGCPDCPEPTTPTSEDCQPNGVPDECDVGCPDCPVPTPQTSQDSNANGVPDECEDDTDTDGDGVIDVLDICDNTPAGVSVDAEGRPLGDIDEDCDTDLADYALFQQGFTGPFLSPPGMVLIPGGEFEMGCHIETRYSGELPVHTVYVDSFYMDVHEVTNQQYCAYLNSAYGQGLIEVSNGGVVSKAGGSEPYCDTKASSSHSRITWNGSTFGVVEDKEDHPMVEVSWYGAVAYANWRSVQHGRQPCYDLSTWECDFAANGYRLPTEAEWEYAARGGLHSPYYKYPWGNDIDGSKANYWDSGDPYETGPYPWTTPVGYYDGGQTPPGPDMANSYGLYDLAGNVWEWCNDWYDSDYYSSSPYDNPQGPATGSQRVFRGGSWIHYVAFLRCASRYWEGPDDRHINFGFRLASGT